MTVFYDYILLFLICWFIQMAFFGPIYAFLGGVGGVGQCEGDL